MRSEIKLFGRTIFSIEKSKEERSITNSVGGWNWFNTGDQESGTTLAGETVTIDKASKIDVAFSCINALSQDIAKLPYNVRKDTKKGKEVVKNNLYNLIHTRPNPWTSAFNFWYYIIFKMLTNGNGYAYIKRNARFEPIQLIQLDPGNVTPIIIEDQVFYSINGAYIPDYDILHYKLYSFDGIVGVSPLIWNADTFGYKIKQEKYSAKVLGQKPPGVLSFDSPMTTEQRKDAQDAWERAIQGDNVGRTPVLAAGAKYTPLMITPTEGQMIEASELNAEKIMGIFRVPPTIIQNYRRATFSNAEQQDLVYTKYALTPIMTAIEQESDFKLFTEREKKSENPPYTAFNFKGMLQGDIKSQTEFYKFLRSHGIASANTILELEDMPRLEGDQGDIIVIQGAFVPLDQLRDVYSSQNNQGNTDPNAARSKQIGFDIQQLKENIERLESMNKL